MAFIRSVIRGVGAYLPQRVLTNEDLSKIVDTTDEWIRERTGIEERHIAADGRAWIARAGEIVDSYRAQTGGAA